MSSVPRFRPESLLPALSWMRRYDRATFLRDALAALIVSLMLVPQSLAYAMLAGLPPVIGLYASMLPLVLYALFGRSASLAVGPAAVLSLMTASAVAPLAQGDPGRAIAAAAILALLSGLMLVAMGLLRLGQVANLLSHPVIGGFISAASLVIAASQIQHLIGVPVAGDNLIEIGQGLYRALPQVHGVTLVLGSAVLAFLWLVRARGALWMERAGLSVRLAQMLVRMAPAFAVLGTIALVKLGGLEALGVRTVGAIPHALPQLSWPGFDASVWAALATPALLLSVIGFVESVSVAQTFAMRQRERVDPDQELIGLGAANIASALSGGLPVTGGVSRSVVNVEAGAATPAAGALTALGIALVAALGADQLSALPRLTLAATIIVAILSLVEVEAFRRTWRYSRRDFAALIVTFVLTLSSDVESGIVAGIALSVLLHLAKASQPHVAVVGLVPGTEHFRNVLRHPVQTCSRVQTLRVDESLYFVNARFIEEKVTDMVLANPALRHLILMCSAVNDIDSSALEALEGINRRLTEAGIGFHLSEVKGPVMDRLRCSDFLDRLNGQVFLSQYQAFERLCAEADATHATAGAV